MFEQPERKVSLMEADDKDDLRDDLRNAQKDIDLAYSRRLALILRGRSEGVSNREIGWSLGLTEAAVRAIIRRSNAEESVNHPKWHTLSDKAKELFVTLLSSGHVNMAGLIDFSPNKRYTFAGPHQDELNEDLDELELAGLLVADHEVDEVFIPSAVQYKIKALDDYLTVDAASPKILIAFGETLQAKRAEQPDLPIWRNRITDQKIKAAQQWKARA
jgi:hypothetical protein